MEIYSVDIETYKWNKDKSVYEPILDTNEFTIGAITNKRYETQFYTTPQSMFKAIIDISEKNEAKNKKTIFIAHNHEYDFYGYAKHYMKELLNKEVIKIVNTTPFVTLYKKKTYYSDLFSFFPMSLEAVGNLINLPKLEMPNNPKSIFEIQPYLKRDTDIVMKAILKVLDFYKTELNYKPTKIITAPSLAMNYFMNRLSKDPKAGWLLRRGVIHKNKENIPFIRQSIRGGRNEALKVGKFKNCTYLDINSAYWESMVKMKFPDLIKERRINKQDIEFLGEEFVLSKIGVTHAKVKCIKSHIGLLGCRIKIPGESMYKQFFPSDGEIITGHWTNEELVLAKKEGYEIIEIYESVIFEKELDFNPIKETILDLWELRKKNKDDKLMNYFLKLTGNGFYGKFIQKKTDKTYKWISREKLDDYLEEGWKVISATAGDYTVYKEQKPYIPKYLSVILGTYITATTRIKLYLEMKKIEEQDLLYVDTDSMIIKNYEKYKDRLDVGEELGQFKIEKDPEDNQPLMNAICKINGEKQYYIRNKITIGGLLRKLHSKDVLDKQQVIETQRIVGYKQGIHFGGFEKIGTFETINKEYKEKSKSDYILPKEIIEESL